MIADNFYGSLDELFCLRGDCLMPTSFHCLITSDISGDHWHGTVTESARCGTDNLLERFP